MESDEEILASNEVKTKPKEKIETGIMYLSRIPTKMTVKTIRQIFSVYGEIGRIFLQPDEKQQGHSKLKKQQQRFSEGWVEFTDKRIAKRIAKTLNSTQIGGKRKNPWYDEFWNIKYLSKFKWIHLNERLAYEREVHKQRLRTEVAQAKRETAFFKKNVERRRIQKKLEKKGEQLDTLKREWTFQQRTVDDEGETSSGKRKRADSKNPAGKKQKKMVEDNRKPSKNKEFMKRIFSGGLQASSDDDDDGDNGGKS